MNTLIFNKDKSFLMAVSSIPSQDYLDTDLYIIATTPKGEVFDSKYSYSPVDGVAVKGDLISVDTDEIDKLTAEWNAKAYSRNREKEYPSIGDQLDALYHAGVFPADMTATLKAVKDKHPKS